MPIGLLYPAAQAFKLSLSSSLSSLNSTYLSQRLVPLTSVFTLRTSDTDLTQIFGKISTFKCKRTEMCLQESKLMGQKGLAQFRLCSISGHKIDLLEIRAEDPGVISFYIDFLEDLYELLGGTASITGSP